MGKYLDRKTEIETEMQEAIDRKHEAYTAEYEAAQAFNEKECVQRIEAAAERYDQACAPIRERAIEREGHLFDDARRDLEAALIQAPTSDQLAYLQTLSLRSDLSSDDINQAAVMMKGNALAEKTLSDIAEKNRLGFSYAAPCFNFREIADGLDAFQERRAEAIGRYGALQGGLLADEAFNLCFLPSDSCGAFDAMEEAIERYSA